MLRDAARSIMLKAGMALCLGAVLAFVCVVPAAFAAEASSVVTVEGSVSSVDGTVALTSATVEAIGDAVGASLASGGVSVLATPDADTLAFYKLVAGGVALGVVSLATLVGLKVAGR